MTEALAGGRWQEATVVEIVPRTARISSFLLQPDAPFAHIAGQHVDVRLTAPDGYAAMRSYSIASAPGVAGPLELAVERLDDGEVSPFFHDVVEKGDRIELRGPLGGHFVWSVADGGPLLLIGAGSGLVPLMAMLRHLRLAGADVPAALLLSSRTWDEVLYRDELLAMAEAMPGFSLTLAITREPARRSGDFGRRIDADIVRSVAERLPAHASHVFVCGSNAFVNAGADGALAAGVPASVIRTERYGT